MKRTPLYHAHTQLGGKLIEFGGWEMPVQYTSIVDEHLTVRQAAGLFDISHMGEIICRGTGAESFLNQVLTNNVTRLSVGLGQYTLMCNEQGGVVDDLYVYRRGAADYLLIVNASRLDVDASWLKAQLAAWPGRAGVQLLDESGVTGAVAVQGPRVAGFIDQVFKGPSKAGLEVSQPTGLKKNQIALFSWAGGEAWVSRTGYTGEDGFEAVAAGDQIEGVWNAILQAGKTHGIKPAGLGARDTLRTEVCYPLYGHELDERTTPIEAGLGFFVAFDKGDFLGRAPLLEQKTKGVRKKLVAFKMTGRSAPPRPGYVIWSAADVRLGDVVSGTQSPSLGQGIGMGYVPPGAAQAQTPVQIEIRGNRAPAMIVPKPLYRKAS